MKILILGGSGNLSRRVAELAMAAHHDVWTLTRGVSPLPQGVHPLTANRREDDTVRAALAGAGTTWDAVIDCTCRTPADAQQDLALLPPYTSRLVMVSTDSVYHPCHKQVPQDENAPRYMDDGGYGHMKREMERTMERADTTLRWTIFRPGHIFGEGFLTGCYPEHPRQKGLPAHMRADRPLRLVDGGSFLIQPIYCDDLALALIDCIDKPAVENQIFCIGGPDVVTNAEYYQLLGRILGHEAIIENVPLEGYLEAHPEYSGHLCHRSYTLAKLRAAGVRVPDTSLEEGLRRQVAWLDAHN